MNRRVADPVATVFQGTATVATNDHWAGDTQVVANGTTLGALGFTASTSLDAAFVTSPAVGSYSVQIAGRNNGTGIARIWLRIIVSPGLRVG